MPPVTQVKPSRLIESWKVDFWFYAYKITKLIENIQNFLAVCDFIRIFV